MGTRSSAKIKLRTPLFKCDVCSRRLMSAEALRTHQLCIHNITKQTKTKTAPKQGINKSKTQPQAQKTKNIKVEKPKSVPTKKATIKPDNKIPEKNMVKRPTKTIETCNEYECPKCFQNFPIYFQALRHIQKYHCVNDNGEKVSPNSPDLIKPNVMVLCLKCNRRPKSLETHKCSTFKYEKVPTESTLVYTCMGCQEKFQSLRLFDLHVSGLHCDGVESMFFPTNEVFQAWKNDVMEQKGLQYYILGNYNYKQMLRCPNVPDDIEGDISSYLCPSLIVVQELPKGIQVHFYKNHYGHKCGAYELPEKFKKYTLSTLIENEEAYTINTREEKKTTETDLYKQFKQLMECIIQDSANIKMESLKVLINKALDMTTVLSDEVNSDSFQSIKMILENSNIKIHSDNVGKRKSVNDKKIEPITKRFKTRTYQNKDGTKTDGSIKIINSYSLAEHEIIDAINDNETGNVTPDNEIESKITDKEKDVFKFKKIKLPQSPSSFAESYKVFVKQLSEPGQPTRKGKLLNKQIKTEPQIPKEISVKQEANENDISVNGQKEFTVPIEYKYEVKEQENDCNILILKC